MPAASPGDTLDEHLTGDDLGEDLSQGGTWLLDLVAAVDYLGRGYRCGLTVWDALEEALRWANTTEPSSDVEPTWDDPDPLGTALRRITGTADTHEPNTLATGLACVLQQAVRRWVTVAAEQYNDSHAWPHPLPRRSFPPALLTDPDAGA